MRIRDVMSRDFRMIDADWPADRAREAVARFTSTFVIVRHSERENGARDYYIFNREDLLNRLVRSAVSDIREGLRLNAASPAHTIVSNKVSDELDAATRPTPGPQIVLSGQGPIGVIVPVRRTRSISRGLPQSLGFPKGLPQAVSVSTGLPPSIVNDGAENAAGSVTRSLVADLPARVEQGATISMMVSLVEAVAGGPGKTLSRPVGSSIDIVVKPLQGLSLVGAGEGTLVVLDPQPDSPLQFKLIAGASGTGSVRVYAFCNGANVAALELETSIVAAAVAVSKTAAPQTTEIHLAQRTRPDLSMYIFERGSELSFNLQSADGELQMIKFGPTLLKTSPQEHFRGFFRDIENLPIDTPQQRQVAKRRLERKGSNLFDLVFPEDLKGLLWKLKDRIRTVQITSDEPWIPWEMCRLKGLTDGRVEEGMFFAEAFNMTRWLYGVSAAPQLCLNNWAVVVPGDSQLANAPEEKKYVLSLAGTSRKVTEVPATYLDVTDAMAAGKYDVWHFTGHARADANTDADQSAIELADREVLKPEDVTGQVENVLQTRPFVFLNACQSAQGGLSLTGVGGWAQRFLKPSSLKKSASAFIGSYWSVYDEAALGFATALYKGLIAGKPIGQAAKEARLSIRGQESPDWLAYTVYADPNATLMPA